jgi:P-type E1-E2 ATPase
VRAFPGQGIRGTVTLDGRRREVAVGTPAFVADGSGAGSGALTSVEVGWDGVVRGRVLLTEKLRTDAREAVAAMHRRGMRTVLVSGDREEVARHTGEEAGIDEVEAPRRPDEKIALVAASGARAIMVGYGINDAPALAAAQTGIALGAGTDLARQAGNVVLLSDRLVLIPWLVDLSRKTRRIIAQNLAWAFGYNAVALGAAACGWLHPLFAALAMTVSSVTVLANAVRIQGFPDPLQTPRSK